jgi:uncharacterized protein
VAEPGSRAVVRWLRDGEVATSRLSEVEVASALIRRARDGQIAASERDRALAGLGVDLEGMHVVEVLPEVAARARILLGRHSLRAGDAIQLASCVYLSDELAERVPLVAFDGRLRLAAREAGVVVLPRRLAAG